MLTSTNLNFFLTLICFCHELQVLIIVDTKNVTDFIISNLFLAIVLYYILKYHYEAKISSNLTILTATFHSHKHIKTLRQFLRKVIN